MAANPTFATTCHVGQVFVPCDLVELAPLLEFLARGESVSEPRPFPRGTLLPDGRLDLCKQVVGPIGTRAVAGALRGHPQVAHLLLGADGLGNEGAEAVAGLAAARPDLRTVYLGCNYIDARGVEKLAVSLCDHPGLRGLWLKRNPLG